MKTLHSNINTPENKRPAELFTTLAPEKRCTPTLNDDINSVLGVTPAKFTLESETILHGQPAMTDAEKNMGDIRGEMTLDEMVRKTGGYQSLLSLAERMRDAARMYLAVSDAHPEQRMRFKKVLEEYDAWERSEK